MGEVYRAEDTRLRRMVALKLLPAEVSAHWDRLERFRREAEAVAKLNHPNIVTIHSIEESDGVHFLTLELVEGKTLAGFIPSSGMKLEKLLAFARPLAEALSVAHDHGITHRDLKPSNIMVTNGGRVKILDFGLAKLHDDLEDGEEGALQAATTLFDSPSLTQAGAVMGTVPYMSPEQLRGEPLDHRSDIFSLGIILYEMATGHRPFDSTSAITMISSIMEGSHEPVSNIRRDVPRHLSRIIEGCLEKDPDHRFQSALDVRNQLETLEKEMVSGVSPLVTAARWIAPATRGGRRWAVVVIGLLLLAGLFVVARWARAPSGEIATAPRAESPLVAKRILVLPFENRTGDAGLNSVGLMAADWLTQGLTETGRVELVPIDQAASAARMVAEEQTETDDSTSIARLARITAAGTVVSGAYYQQDDRLLVHAQITDVSAGSVVTTVDPVETPVANPAEALEALRQRVTAAIATRIDPELAAVANLVSRVPSFEAYESYVVGMERYDAMDFRGAIEAFKEAAAADSEYFTPLLLAAAAHYNLRQYADAEAILATIRPRRESLALLDRYNLDWLTAECAGDRPAALRAVRKAAELAPRSHWAFRRGVVALMSNYPREAQAAMAGIDPERGFLTAWVPYFYHYTSAFHYLGDHAGELEQARRVRARHPDSVGALGIEIRALAALGRTEDVRRLVEESVSLRAEWFSTPGSMMTLAAQELRAHGQEEPAGELAARALEWYEARPQQERAQLPHRERFAWALVHVGRLADAQAAFEALLEESPEHLDYRGARAVMAARIGDLATAHETLGWLEALDRPFLFGENYYWQAAIISWLGEPDRAVSLLREAMARGRLFHWAAERQLHVDPMVKPLWQEDRFRELLAPRD